MHRLGSGDLLLNKYCNELNSDDKRQRKKALENIKKEMLCNNLDCSEIARLFEQVQKYLIRCFKDSTEAVRETSVIIVTEILKIIPAKEIYISSLIPIVSERLSGDVILETSEEVRLCLVGLLSLLCAKYKESLFHYLDDFIKIFVKSIIDPYPKVKKESCDCVAELAKSIPQYFHLQSESLIPSLVQTLSHQQYRIRVAGINSIGAVVQYGNNKSVSEVCGPLAERLFDQHHAVRVAVTKVFGMWLLELPDRYSYFHKLIPLMLTSLSEEIPDHRREAEELWTKVGKQFMLENETDLKDKINYLDDHLEHYPQNVCRPNLGCRTLVQRELSRYLPAIATELDDWKADIRVKSAQLLCVTVQHAEGCITQHLEKTLPVLYKACADTDPRVSDNIELAAEMIGYFVMPEVYCRLMLPIVLDATSSGPLRVLAAVLRSSQQCALQPQLETVADTLASTAVCYSRQAQYQKQLLNTVQSLLNVMQEDVVPVTQQLFNVTVSALGMAADKTISKLAQELIERLSKYNKIAVKELYKTHSHALLESVADSADEWTLHSPQASVFEALLTNAGAAVGLNISRILFVLETCVNPENEPEAILQMLMAVSYVLTHSDETLAEVNDMPQVIHQLCTKVLQPHLVWRAGRSAEALRTAATGCLVAALDLIQCSRSLTEVLVPLLLTLVEDSAYKTRQFATLSLLCIVKSLRSTDSLVAQDINTIFVVVMKRLDDNNDIVRDTALRLLCELFRAPLPGDYSIECYHKSLEALYDTMLLHLDDPVETFQDTMLGALKEVAAHPKLLRSRIKMDNFRNKAKCEELIKFLEEVHL